MLQAELQIYLIGLPNKFADGAAFLNDIGTINEGCRHRRQWRLEPRLRLRCLLDLLICNDEHVAVALVLVILVYRSLRIKRLLVL